MSLHGEMMKETGMRPDYTYFLSLVSLVWLPKFDHSNSNATNDTYSSETGV